MSYSVGLSLYNLAGRRDAQGWVAGAARPRGDLIWLHGANAEVLPVLQALARRLTDEDGQAVLLTGPAPLPRNGAEPAQSGGHPALHPAPGDHPAEVKAFMDHWAPSLIVLAGGEIRPALLQDAALRGVPVLMVEARSPHLMPGREGWYPGLMRGALAQMRHILVPDDAAARAFRRAGADAFQVQVLGHMERQSAALPCLEAERAALAQALATRPVWLAAGVPRIEEAAVISAHREALRLSHRLVLILVPEDPARAVPLAAELEATEGWSVALRSAEQEPGRENEVYIPDSAAEYGLWYRLAPVTFLGGSLLGEGCGRSPMEPAALGSAIVYGPRPGQFGAAYGRLGAARAARAVASAADLQAGLNDLLSPDRAARLAQAAWTVSSEGVEVTARVLDLIRQRMDA